MFDGIYDQIRKNQTDLPADDLPEVSEEMYFNWYFYVNYYITPELKVYRKHELVCACKMAVN